MSYWDTSCLVKLYTPEAESLTLRSHVLGGATVVTSDISRLELWATLRRKEADGVLAAGEARTIQRAFDADVIAGDLSVISTSASVRGQFEAIVERFYSRSPPIYIRTLDAWHLAAAQSAGETEIVATDKRLREAAQVLGLTVFPPP